MNSSLSFETIGQLQATEKYDNKKHISPNKGVFFLLYQDNDNKKRKKKSS